MRRERRKEEKEWGKKIKPLDEILQKLLKKRSDRHSKRRIRQEERKTKEDRKTLIWSSFTATRAPRSIPERKKRERKQKKKEKIRHLRN